MSTLPSKIAGVPEVVTTRRELASWKKFHHRILWDMGNLCTDNVVACSEAARQFAIRDEKLSFDRITTIYNCIDTESFRPQPKNEAILKEFNINNNETIIGMVTKLEVIKGIDSALMTFSLLVKDCPSLKLLIVGGGRNKKDAEKRTIKLGIENKVIFADLRDEILHLLSVMDIFLLTSLREGLPNAILEAMACQLPVVATKTGGIPEVVREGETGFLAGIKDYQKISGVFMKMIEDRQFRLDMGKKGRILIENNFTLGRMVSEYEHFYLSAINRKAK